MSDRTGRVLTVVVAGALLGLGVYVATGDGRSGPVGSTAPTSPVGSTAPTASTSPPPVAGETATTKASPPSATTIPPPVREPGTVPAWTVGRPWGTTQGLTMFRGNPTRTFYGTGPVPEAPTVAWRYPESQMCSRSSDEAGTRVWCGMGWTGQPVVWERPDGITELIFGAYDAAVHFVDAATGGDLRPEFQTGDLIKGTVTLDPDGYPLLYFGSRDNLFRILALDREQPTLLWSMDADEVDGIWNNDWDSNPVIVDDVLYQGGENGWFYAILLNRGYDGEGRVTIAPEPLVRIPGYDDDLIAVSGRNLSIESSVVAFEDRVYFANSGGRVVGLDASRIRGGEAAVVFDYYTGGDIDATMVVDAEGMLYVSIEHEPSQMGAAETARNRQVGQLVKLDPYRPTEPRVWGIDLTAGASDSGSWATPALYQGMVYVNTHQGELLAVDAEDGGVVWRDEVGFHSWSSPVVVDDTLITATCLGDVRAYSLENPRSPRRIWSLSLGPSCLEATPAIWAGSIYIGSRDGYLRALR